MTVTHLTGETFAILISHPLAGQLASDRSLLALHELSGSRSCARCRLVMVAKNKKVTGVQRAARLLPQLLRAE